MWIKGFSPWSWGLPRIDKNCLKFSRGLFHDIIILATQSWMSHIILFTTVTFVELGYVELD